MLVQETDNFAETELNSGLEDSTTKQELDG